MKSVVQASLVLAGLVAGLTVAIIAAGLHERPAVSLPLFIFGTVALNVAVLFWALRRTAAENPYGRQLAHAALVGLLGGLLIAAVSLLLTGAVFPDFLAESKAAQAELLQASLPAGQELQEALARNDARTPVAEALGGLAGTLGTSILAGAFLSLFLRRR